MRLTDRIERVTATVATPRMPRADREMWESARTLDDLCELTAMWLEGAISSQPAYSPGCGPDEETAELIPVLAACNRAHFMTDGSQPADDGLGYDGCRWLQRAAVTGFATAETAEAITRAMSGTDLIVQVLPSSRRSHRKTAIPVTFRAGSRYAHTHFGTQLSRSFLRDDWTGYGICHDDAVTALCEAMQVTIVDPAEGRNDVLWPALAAFAGLVSAS